MLMQPPAGGQPAKVELEAVWRKLIVPMHHFLEYPNLALSS
jgi:hypothetical protein